MLTDTPSWPEACAVLVEACLSDSFAVAPQAFRVLEGVLDLQLRRATGGVRFGTVGFRWIVLFVLGRASCTLVLAVACANIL